jgi:hypothetical protein
MVGRIWTKGTDGKTELQEDRNGRKRYECHEEGDGGKEGRGMVGRRKEQEGRGMDGRRKEMVERYMDARRRKKVGKSRNLWRKEMMGRDRVGGRRW